MKPEIKVDLERQQRAKGKNAYEIVNNGEIEFRYTEALRRLGVRSDTTITNAIDALVGVGFIDIAQTGMGLKMYTTLYAISDRWRLYGTPEFKEATRPTCKRGYGFQKGNSLAKLHKPKTSIKAPAQDGL